MVAGGGGGRALAWGLLLGAAALGGCGPLQHTVRDRAFADLTVDKKLRLFDAENDVSLATDDREQMGERLQALDDDAAAAARGRRGARGPAMEAMWGKRLQYLSLCHDYLVRRARAQATVIDSARGKFELAKALLVKKNRLDGAESLDLKRFEAQATQLEGRARAALAEVAKGRPQLERSRLEWLKQRDEATAASLSAALLPGEDEQPVWELW